MATEKRPAPAAFLATLVTLDGVERTVQEWCTELGLEPLTVYSRRSKAYSWKEAFAPVKGSNTLRKHITNFYNNRKQLRHNAPAKKKETME